MKHQMRNTIVILLRIICLQFVLQVFPSDIEFAEGGPEEASTDMPTQVYMDLNILDWVPENKF